jgi:signal transduction histidine kinase
MDTSSARNGSVRDPAEPDSFQEPLVKRFSLTGRIIVAVVSCQLLLALGLPLAAVFYARGQFQGAFDAALQGHAVSTLASVRYSQSEPPGLLFDSTLLPPSFNPVHPDVFEILASDGQLIARSGGSAEFPPAVMQSGRQFSDFMLGGVEYRAISLRQVAVLDNEDTVRVPARVTVFYGSSLVDVHRRLIQLALFVAGMSILLLLIASALVAWSVRRGLEPLHELAEQAGAITVHNWTFRSPSDAALASELAPLVRAIETVLARLKESFRQQREFTSDAAHELKTSAAIIKSTTQSLLQRPRTAEEYRAGLERLLEDSGRLEDLLERMLRLARIEKWTESGSPGQLGITELKSTCESAVSRIQALADARNIQIRLNGQDTINLRADPEDLELIWVNLLENAVHYSPAGARVTLHLQRNGAGWAKVSVEDSGPGISSDEMTRVFDRFHRADPSRARSSGGFGLGLAICKALVDAYGGRIEVFNRDQGGTEVRVALPAEAESTEVATNS